MPRPKSTTTARARTIAADVSEESDLPAKAPRGSSATVIYKALQQDIISMQLRPGETMDEVSLSQRFNVSRAPVREAIIRLNGEGLVTIFPNRSAIVSNIDLQSLPPYLDALELIQRTVSRLAAENRSDAQLEEIRAFESIFAQARQQQDLDGLLTANYDFHMAIAEAGGNPYFTSLYGRLLNEGKRLTRVHYTHDTTLQVDEHEMMIAAIARRDADGAEEAGYLHAVEFRQRILSQLQNSLTREISVARAGA